MLSSPRFPKPKANEKASEYKQFAEAGISYLAADPAELNRFMVATGYDPARLRTALGSDEMDRAIVDYFAANEAALLAMCANMNLEVERFMATWHRLNRTI